MCLGTLASAAFFMMNLTNFIVDAEGRGSGEQPRRPINSEPQSGPAFLPHGRPWKPVGGADVTAASCDQ